MTTATLSATARHALSTGIERSDGRVYAPKTVIGKLVGLKLVENPHYEYGGRGRHSWATITDAGRADMAEWLAT